MPCGEARGPGCTRRAIIGGVVCLQVRPASEKGRWFSSDRREVLDPATEFPLLRLTDPAYASCLPAGHLRSVARTGAFLLYASDRNGLFQAFLMDLRTGQQQQLSEVGSLDPSSLALMPNERDFCCLDGAALRRVTLRNLREKEIYRVPEGWRRGDGFSLSRDGSYAALVEVRGETYRLRLVRISSGKAATIVEGTESVSEPRLHTRREGVLYRQGADSLCLASLDGRSHRRLAAAAGKLGPFLWSPDGKSVLYLNERGPGWVSSGLRELLVDSGADRLVAETSRFVAFSANVNGSVFVGASGNRAGPYVLLLLRSMHRELALCEHGASDPARVAPVFSSDSQRVYFQSDREGKWVIYCAAVDRLVERTAA